MNRPDPRGKRGRRKKGTGLRQPGIIFSGPGSRLSSKELLAEIEQGLDEKGGEGKEP